jgi:hypothetical protein
MGKFILLSLIDFLVPDAETIDWKMLEFSGNEQNILAGWFSW